MKLAYKYRFVVYTVVGDLNHILLRFHVEIRHKLTFFDIVEKKDKIGEIVNFPVVTHELSLVGQSMSGDQH